MFKMVKQQNSLSVSRRAEEPTRQYFYSPWTGAAAPWTMMLMMMMVTRRIVGDSHNLTVSMRHPVQHHRGWQLVRNASSIFNTKNYCPAHTISPLISQRRLASLLLLWTCQTGRTNERTNDSKTNSFVSRNEQVAPIIFFPFASTD